MKLLPLQQVRAQVRAGAPLPFGIRDAEGVLLLARGQSVADERALAELLERGAMVDMEEAALRRGEAVAPPAENFPGRWHQLTVRAAVLLRPPLAPDFFERVHEVVEQLGSMAERDGDLLLYLALRSARDPGAQYGSLHALHVAVVCLLMARRLGWDEPRCGSLAGAALTMNLAIVDLLSRMGPSMTAPTPALRETIERHAEDGVALLRKAGLEDEAWLQTVAQHHAPPPGSDDAPSEATQLLRLVDAYTLRITDRPDTIIASPAIAARELFAQRAKDPLALLLVKVLGVYPPGCFVRIASGETAVVLRRGEAANKPQVACITNKRGDALQQPIRRDTGLLPEHAITAVVPDKEVKVRMPSQLLYA